MSCTHAKHPVPTDPAEKARYYWAKRQTAVAQEQGMSNDESMTYLNTSWTWISMR